VPFKLLGRRCLETPITIFSRPLRCCKLKSETYRPGFYVDNVWMCPPGAHPEPGDVPQHWRVKYTLDYIQPHSIDSKRDFVSLTTNPLSSFIRSFTKFGNYYCNDSCSCNNAVALVERLFQNATKNGPRPFPPSDPFYEQELGKTFRMFSANFREHTSGEALTAEECFCAFKAQNDKIESQLGMLGFHTSVADPERYRRSYEYWKEIMNLPLHEALNYTLTPPEFMYSRWAKVRPFAKVESIDRDKWPRNISPRHPHFNFLWAQFTKPMESYFYHHLSASGHLKAGCPLGKEPGVRNPWIGKSMNKLQRGNAVKYKFDLFERTHGVKPIVISTDGVGFDAHMTQGVIKQENKCWQNCFPSHRVFLQKLTKSFEENNLVSDGVRGKIRGTRMSGDMHTGLGNTIVTIGMIVTSMRLMGIKRYDIFADGDDTLIFVHPDDLGQVMRELPINFLGFGHELKMEKIATNIFEVEWCQSKIVRVTKEGVTQFIFVQNPHKTFATMGSHIHCRDNVSAFKYYGDVLYAYSRMYSCIPLFRKLAGYRESHDVRVRRLQPGIALELINNAHLDCVEGPDTLSDYCQAWDLDPSIYQGHMTGDPDELRAAIADQHNV